MDGIQATRAIRERGHCAATPIIALTAHSHDDDRDRCLEAGMNDFVTKPYRKETLLAAMAHYLSQSTIEHDQADTTEAVGTVGDPSPTAGTPYTELLDRSALSQLESDIGADRTGELARVFTQEALNRVERMLGADKQTIMREAHSLKSGSGIFGANAMRELAVTIERQAQTDDWEALSHSIVELEDLAPKLVRAINERYPAAETVQTP